MTTLFEDPENANPPSPSLDILDNPSMKNELGHHGRKAVPTTGTSTTPQSSIGISSGDAADVSGNSNSIATADAFTPFVDGSSQLDPDNVRVVHLTEDASSSSATDPTNTSGGTLYTVGTSGQIQQVSENNSITAVTVDGTSHDGRYTYYPAVQANDGSQGGQFYVMMSSQDVIPVGNGNSTPRIIAPRTQGLQQAVELPIGKADSLKVKRELCPIQEKLARKSETTRSSRDERRRATHNEVERRRRDKINTWIMKIAAVVPDCQMDQSKQGTSKGGVLSKALDHIIKLRTENDRMRDTIKEQERLLVENQVLRQQVEKLRQENTILAANIPLRQHDGPLEQQHKAMETE